MINLKKIVAVALSAAMCLGLGVTAFAAESTTRTVTEWESEDYMRESIGPNGIWANNQTSADHLQVRDAKGNLIGHEYRVPDGNGGFNNVWVNGYEWSAISNGTWKSIDEEGKVQEIFQKNGYDVNKDMDFVPILSGTITLTDGVPEGGAVLTFGLKDMGLNSEDVKPGDTVYMMQETNPGSGVWEVYAAQVSPGYDIAVNVPRNGALVLVKVMSNGDVITLDKTTGNVINRVPADSNTNTTTTPSGSTSTSNSAAASAGTSPKTGEF